MDRVEKIRVQDRTKIERVTFKFPEFMNANAECLVEQEYYGILSLEEELARKREEVRVLETKLNDKRATFRKMSEMFDLEFASYEKEKVIHDNDVRFKGLGNDIIGRPAIS